MGVYAHSAVDFTAIGSEMAVVSSAWMNGSIEIIDANTEAQSWDPVTNEYTGGEATVLWSGPARIQHLSSKSVADAGFTEVSTRGIRFQIPNDSSVPFVRKGLQIIVTDGGNDPKLEEFSYLVVSSVNSSYAWLRTIEAEVDMKSVAFGGA